jgi:predicted nucleotidyltransferase
MRRNLRFMGRWPNHDTRAAGGRVLIPNLGICSPNMGAALTEPNPGTIIPNMGGYVQTASGVAAALFSRVQLRVLGLIFGQPDRAFHLSELIRLAGSGTGAVQRELKKLAAAGIVTVTDFANRKLYQANRQCPIFNELRGIVLKTVGLVEPIRDCLERLSSEIAVAFVYGSIAGGSDTASSDIDLMVIGQGPSYGEIYAALQKAEKALLRPVNPTLMTSDEWARKFGDQNAFVRNILRQPKLFVFGTENDLEGIGQSRGGRTAEARAARPKGVRRPTRLGSKASR